MSHWRFNPDVERWQQTNTWGFEEDNSENSFEINSEFSENSDNYSYITQDYTDFHEENSEIEIELLLLRLSAPAA